MKQLCPAKQDKTVYIVLAKDGVKYTGSCPQRYLDESNKHVRAPKKI
jgi:hypothetical protein